MEDRRRILQQKGCIVWITGLSGSGKSTVAFAMDRILNSMSKVNYVLDGDKIREGLCKDLGFSEKDSQENIRRVGETAALFADAGLITVVSFISSYKRDRDRVRQLVPVGSFIEVFMDVPLEVCEKRDAKGLYNLARQGVIKAFTGIDDPYEKSVNPEIVIKAVNEHGVCVTPESSAGYVMKRKVQFSELQVLKLVKGDKRQSKSGVLIEQVEGTQDFIKFCKLLNPVFAPVRPKHYQHNQLAFYHHAWLAILDPSHPTPNWGDVLEKTVSRQLKSLSVCNEPTCLGPYLVHLYIHFKEMESETAKTSTPETPLKKKVRRQIVVESDTEKEEEEVKQKKEPSNTKLVGKPSTRAQTDKPVDLNALGVHLFATQVLTRLHPVLL